MTSTSSTKVKCCIVGDGAVGKTSLLYAFDKNQFIDGSVDYLPTVYEQYEITTRYQGNSVSLGVHDFGGSGNIETLRRLEYPGTNVLVLCFSVVNPASLDNLTSQWHPEVSKNLPNTPFILVGTKIDLREDGHILKSLVEKGIAPISKAQGEQLRKKLGAVAYIETSSKTKEGIVTLFNKVMEIALSPVNKTSSGCVVA